MKETAIPQSYIEKYFIDNINFAPLPPCWRIGIDHAMLWEYLVAHLTKGRVTYHGCKGYDVVAGNGALIEVKHAIRQCHKTRNDRWMIQNLDGKEDTLFFCLSPDRTELEYVFFVKKEDLYSHKVNIPALSTLKAWRSRSFFWKERMLDIREIAALFPLEEDLKIGENKNRKNET
jgi:hypothetical protein